MRRPFLLSRQAGPSHDLNVGGRIFQRQIGGFDQRSRYGQLTPAKGAAAGRCQWGVPDAHRSQVALLRCPALLAAPSLACAEPPSPLDYRAGCERTGTANYSAYISPGWNSVSPKAMIFASDSQYPRTLDNPNDPAGSAAALRRVFADMADYRRRAGGPVPLVVNGDLTEYAHGDQRDFLQGLFPKLAGGSGEPLMLPGLGNHDYGNNVDDCTNNGCARDAICDHVYWVDEIGPVTEDYHYARPLHEGSFSYMVYVGGIALIQLNDSPFYEREFGTGTGVPGDDKRRFQITSSLRWLEGALRKARQDNKSIFINLHKRNGWPSGDTARCSRRSPRRIRSGSRFRSKPPAACGRTTGSASSSRGSRTTPSSSARRGTPGCRT